jgi:3-oxoacyl-[acyl-carrier protein] reductase
MELGIAGRRALVFAASRGLGKACALALAREGVQVTIVARNREALASAAEEIRSAAGTAVTAVAGDVTTPEGRAAALRACPDPDILINNAGGPPAASFRDLSRDDWLAALNANMLSAIELIKATVDPMIARKWGRIVNITSSAVKAPIASLDLSNGARAGLTGFVGGLARELAPTGVTLNNLLPGTFATDRIDQWLDHRSRSAGLSRDEAGQELIARIPMGRMGRPEEFGAVCAFLCSHHAAYVTGQNVLIDGGVYPGVL